MLKSAIILMDNPYGSDFVRMQRALIYLLVLLFLSIAFSSSIHAAVFIGQVNSPSGEPLEGAIVTIIDNKHNKKFSVYSDEQGSYQLNYDASYAIDIRARYFSYVDRVLPVDKPGEDQTINFTLQAATNDQIRQQLPSHVWVERIAKISPEIDREFRIECMMCHQQGNNMARWPTNREQWHEVFDRMAHKNAMVVDETKEKTIDALLAAYKVKDDSDLPRIPPMPKGRETKVSITEWGLPAGTFMHDIAVGPDGLIYGASARDNQIWRLNPETNLREKLDHVKPDDNFFVGDKLGLHTVLASPDKKSMWFTYARGNILSRYDIPSNSMKVWNISYLDGLYPHTLRFDSKGQVWFTVTATNQLGTVNPETQELEFINLPTRSFIQKLFAWPPMAGLLGQIQLNTSFTLAFEREIRPIAYGIAITPDDKVWFSQYNNRRIGYYDPKTKEIKMIDTPFGGPRRFRSDSKGDLWIPAFTDGRIYKYEPGTDKFTGYDLPTGASDSVYALAVDPNDDTVWGCGSNSDTMLHFDPKTEAFTTYRFPSLVTFCREISFDNEGNVWTSYSNAPVSSIEGGVTVMVKLSPQR